MSDRLRDAVEKAISVHCGNLACFVAREGLREALEQELAEREKVGQMSDKLREAAEAMCQGCRDGWPARKIVGDRIYWWHDFGNISRECECAPIQKLIEQAALSASPAPAPTVNDGLIAELEDFQSGCVSGSYEHGLYTQVIAALRASPASTKETGAREQDFPMMLPSRDLLPPMEIDAEFNADDWGRKFCAVLDIQPERWRQVVTYWLSYAHAKGKAEMAAYVPPPIYIKEQP